MIFIEKKRTIKICLLLTSHSENVPVFKNGIEIIFWRKSTRRLSLGDGRALRRIGRTIWEFTKIKNNICTLLSSLSELCQMHPIWEKRACDFEAIKASNKH